MGFANLHDHLGDAAAMWMSRRKGSAAGGNASDALPGVEDGRYDPPVMHPAAAR
jgi:hypothetical protein